MDAFNIRRTPLNAVHRQSGGRLIEFGGWEMPVQYTSIVEEHCAVRSAAGLFDISHMGEFRVSGPDAKSFLDQVLTNELSKLQDGWGQYSLLCNDQGGVVDDLYVFRLAPDDFLIVVNASRIEADFSWLEHMRQRQPMPGVKLEDRSPEFGAVAIQGPKVKEFIDSVGPEVLSATNLSPAWSTLKKNQIAPFNWDTFSGWVSRTGYTGEDGFEIIAPAAKIEAVWRRILDVGASSGIRLVGLGARDTLRLEACYPLYGHELDDKTTPVEAGLLRFVGLNKPSFTGHEVLKRQASEGVERQLVAFRMTDKSAPPRAEYPICDPAQPGRKIGRVTSGTMCPSLGVGAGMGYVTRDFAAPGAAITIEIRGRMAAAEVVRKPLYRR